MKTYVWEYVGGLTTNWHSGGALLIITDGDPQDEWKQYRSNQIAAGDDWDDQESLTKELPEPSFSYDCTAPFKGVWVFEDAGCC